MAATSLNQFEISRCAAQARRWMIIRRQPSSSFLPTDIVISLGNCARLAALRTTFGRHCFKQVSVIAKPNAFVPRDTRLMARVDFVLARATLADRPAPSGRRSSPFLLFSVLGAFALHGVRPTRSILASRSKTSQLVPSHRFRTIFNHASLPGSFDH